MVRLPLLPEHGRPTSPDLTKLANSNGGKFPTERVFRTIRGDYSVLAHGTSDMPVWGPIFKLEGASQAEVDRRILALLSYLQTLQTATEARGSAPARPQASRPLHNH
jgi:hypothetical protein